MNKLKQPILILTLLIFSLFYNSLLARGDIDFGGYYKSFFMAFKPVGSPSLGGTNNRIRFKMSANLENWISFHVAYEVSPRVQDPSLFDNNLFFSGIDPRGYRIKDFSDRFYPSANKDVQSFAFFII